MSLQWKHSLKAMERFPTVPEKWVLPREAWRDSSLHPCYNVLPIFYAISTGQNETASHCCFQKLLDSTMVLVKYRSWLKKVASTSVVVLEQFGVRLCKFTWHQIIAKWYYLHKYYGTYTPWILYGCPKMTVTVPNVPSIIHYKQQMFMISKGVLPKNINTIDAFRSSGKKSSVINVARQITPGYKTLSELEKILGRVKFE